MARPSLLRPLLVAAVAAALAFTVFVAIGFASLLAPVPTPTPSPAPSDTPAPTAPPAPSDTPAPTGPSTRLEVRFLDVGQADAILVRAGDAAMLVDAGNNEDAAGLVAYLEALGVRRLDAVVGTHPHEDHIGGLDRVIAAFDIGRVLLPLASNNTATYEDLLLAIASKGLRATAPKTGDAFPLGGATVTVLSPSLSTADELNLHSIVLRIAIGTRAFLLCADAEAPTEAAMLDSGLALSADVLKVAHHGSDSSTTAAFLAAVHPTIAVISVGTGNDYGHPAAATLDRLVDAGATVLRTDRDGTVVVTTDGTSLDVAFEATRIDGSGR